MSEWWKRAEREIRETDALVEREIASGASPVDAVNKHCHTAETYNAAVKKHGLVPVIPD